VIILKQTEMNFRSGRFFSHLSLLIFSILVFCNGIFAEKHTTNIDSLEKVLTQKITDSMRVKVLCDLSWDYKSKGDYDKAMMNAVEAQKLSEKINDTAGLASAYNNMGLIFFREGKYTEALENHHLSLELAQKMGNKKSIAASYNSIALVYQDLGDYAEALQYGFSSLTLEEEIQDKKGIAGTYGNLGVVYHYMGNDSAAIRYFKYTLNIMTELQDKAGMAFSYNNIGGIQVVMGKYDEALENFNKSLELKIALGQKRGVGAVHVNMGDMFLDKGDFDKALENYTEAASIFEKSGDVDGLTECKIDFGIIFTKQGKFADAEKNFNEALVLAQGKKSKNEIKNVYLGLSELDSAKKDFSAAYVHYKLYTSEKDSIQNEENTQKSTRAEMTYDFDKKMAQEKAAQEKLDVQHDAESKNQRNIIYFGSGILLLVLVFAFYAYRSYLQKQKANVELDDKNHKIENAYKIIEHKNTEITDSINYAKKIQQSILPDQQDFLAAFPASFVFHRPKDIVGGDFYFLNTVGGKKFLAVADCTGHGVPGAFMSLVGSRELLLANEKSNSVAEILSHLNRGMKATLKQNQLDRTKDGMDAALISVELGVRSSEFLKMSYAGANRPLWIYRKEKNEMEEIKPTKVAIGGFTPDDQIFQQHEIELMKGDIVFIFSDGYADQFGGDKGKKMTTKKFREFLLANSATEMNPMKNLLEQSFDQWRGSVEQIDDVLVIGIKV
jgi:tetratricopeptide (TPR) repeat protein